MFAELFPPSSLAATHHSPCLSRYSVEVQAPHPAPTSFARSKKMSNVHNIHRGRGIEGKRGTSRARARSWLCKSKRSCLDVVMGTYSSKSASAAPISPSGDAKDFFSSRLARSLQPVKFISLLDVKRLNATPRRPENEVFLVNFVQRGFAGDLRESLLAVWIQRWCWLRWKTPSRRTQQWQDHRGLR